MQKTEKLGLNLFEGSDPVLAESFNENANILEAFCAKAPQIVTGSYMGEYTDNTGDKTLSLPKKPALVLLAGNNCTTICLPDAGTAVILTDLYSFPNKYITCVWDETDSSLKLSQCSNYINFTNKSYSYVAFMTV